MDKAGGSTARSLAEIARLDERRAEPPAGGVARGGCARDAAADDQDVERLGAKPADTFRPVHGVRTIFPKASPASRRSWASRAGSSEPSNTSPITSVNSAWLAIVLPTIRSCFQKTSRMS